MNIYISIKRELNSWETRLLRIEQNLRVYTVSLPQQLPIFTPHQLFSFFAAPICINFFPFKILFHSCSFRCSPTLSHFHVFHQKITFTGISPLPWGGGGRVFFTLGIETRPISMQQLLLNTTPAPSQ
jgi:hypothetical protein